MRCIPAVFGVILYCFLIKFFNQKGFAFGVTNFVILKKSRTLVS